LYSCRESNEFFLSLKIRLHETTGLFFLACPAICPTAALPILIHVPASATTVVPASFFHGLTLVCDGDDMGGVASCYSPPSLLLPPNDGRFSPRSAFLLSWILSSV
jgi:hypothetical protein